MSENKANKESNEIKEMRDAIPELKEIAFKNYHWALLKTWLISIGFLLIGGIIGVVTSQFVSLPSSPFEPSKIEEIAKALIAPSVTMNGLFVTFVPVISFFYIEEIKEEQNEMKEEWQRKKEKFKENKDLKVINSVYNLSHTLLHNVRGGVLRYTRTYLTVSIFSLFFLVCLYAVDIPALFLAIDLILLIIILTGVFPIITMALYKPTLKLVQYIVPERIVERIEYEE